MKKVFFVFVIVALALSSQVYAQTLTHRQILPAVACLDEWRTDLYVLVDASQHVANPRWTMMAEFVPSSNNDLRFQTTFDLADIGSDTIFTIRDFLCQYFPQEAAHDSGTLTLWSSTPFYAWHMSVNRIYQYGSSIPPSETLIVDELYSYFGDTVLDGSYRFNLFMYNANGTTPAMLWVGNDLYALEPSESKRVLNISPVGIIQVIQGDYVHVSVSMVNNYSNDAVSVPVIWRDLF